MYGRHSAGRVFTLQYTRFCQNSWRDTNRADRFILLFGLLHESVGSFTNGHDTKAHSKKMSGAAYSVHGLPFGTKLRRLFAVHCI